MDDQNAVIISVFWRWERKVGKRERDKDTDGAENQREGCTPGTPGQKIQSGFESGVKAANPVVLSQRTLGAPNMDS